MNIEELTVDGDAATSTCRHHACGEKIDSYSMRDFANRILETSASERFPEKTRKKSHVDVFGGASDFSASEEEFDGNLDAESEQVDTNTDREQIDPENDDEDNDVEEENEGMEEEDEGDDDENEDERSEMNTEIPDWIDSDISEDDNFGLQLDDSVPEPPIDDGFKLFEDFEPTAQEQQQQQQDGPLPREHRTLSPPIGRKFLSKSRRPKKRRMIQVMVNRREKEEKRYEKKMAAYVIRKHHRPRHCCRKSCTKQTNTTMMEPVAQSRRKYTLVALEMSSSKPTDSDSKPKNIRLYGKNKT